MSEFKWVNTKDRKPEEHTFVLIKTKPLNPHYGFCFVADWQPSRDLWCPGSGIISDYEITHWSYIPEVNDE